MKTITKTNGTKITIETIYNTSNGNVIIITKTSEKISISDSYNGHHGERVVWTAINMAGARYVKFDGQYWLVVSGSHGNGTMAAHDIIGDAELADSARSIVDANGDEVSSNTYSVNELTILAAYALVSGIHNDGGNVYEIAKKVVAAFAAEQTEATDQDETTEHTTEIEQHQLFAVTYRQTEDSPTCTNIARAISIEDVQQHYTNCAYVSIEPEQGISYFADLMAKNPPIVDCEHIEHDNATDQPTVGELCDSPNEINITGNGYEVHAYQTIMTDWCVWGTIGDCEVDNAWAGIVLATFEDLDDMILDIICDELA